MFGESGFQDTQVSLRIKGKKMRINRKYRPELVVYKDKKNDRPNISHLNVQRGHGGISGTSGCVVATDGKMLVVVPCDREAKDVLGMVQADILPEARRKTKDASLSVRLGKKWVKLGKDTITRRDNPKDKNVYLGFPNTEMILPFGEKKYTARFDVKLLSTISEALGSSYVSVDFYGNMEPIIVRTVDRSCYKINKDSLGLFMGLRVLGE